jgi:hypothetical protein
MLDNAPLKDLLGKNGAARRATEGNAVFAPGLPESERRACRVIATDRASVRYRALRPDDAAFANAQSAGPRLPTFSKT